jgi:hypothetical protein
MPDNRGPITVRCAGSGTSVPMRKATTTCMVRIPVSKASGLCQFCERTERDAR